MKGLLKRQVVLAVLASMMASSAFALTLVHPDRSGRSMSDGGLGGGSISTNSTLSGRPIPAVNIAESIDCSGSRDYLSWDLLNAVADLGRTPFRVEKIVQDGKVDMQVFIPTFPKECLDLEIQIDAIEKPKKQGFFVKVKNNFFAKNPKLVKAIFGKDGSDGQAEMKALSQDTRLTKCFEYQYAKKKDPKNSDAVILTPEDYQLGRVIHLSNPVQVDDLDNVYVYMHSPYDGLIPRKGTVGKIDQKNKCFRAENFNVEDREKPILNSRHLNDKLEFEGCDGEECKQRHMDDFFRILQNEEEIRQLSKIHVQELEAILFGSEKDGKNKGYKNIKDRMDDLIKEISGKGESILEEEDEKELGKLSRDYDSLRFKMENDYIKPLIEILEIKYKMRSEMDKTKETELAEIDKSIKTINELIGMYSNGDVKTSEVIHKFAEFGLTDKAEKAGKLYALSSRWSFVNHEDRDKIKPSEAKNYYEKDVKQLNGFISEYKERYLVRTGKKKNTPFVAARMDSAEKNISRFMNDSYKREMKLRSGCTQTMWGVSNQADCNKYYKGMNTRAEQRMRVQNMHSYNMQKLEKQYDKWRRYEAMGDRVRMAEREARRNGGFGRSGGRQSLFGYDSMDFEVGDSDLYYDIDNYDVMSYGGDNMMMMPGSNYQFRSNFGNDPLLMQRQMGGPSSYQFGGNQMGGQFGGFNNGFNSMPPF